MIWDVDSVLLPVLLENVHLLFSGVLLVTLCNYPHVFQELKGLILICTAGWNFFAKLTEEEKVIICRKLSKFSPLVIPSKHSNSFVTGRPVVLLWSLLSALRYAGIEQIVIYGYGMKCMVHLCKELHNIPLPTTPIVLPRFDFGARFYNPLGSDHYAIPLFTLNNSVRNGRVHKMFLAEGGSVEVQLNFTGRRLTYARYIVYPTVMHLLKALCRVEIQMPKQIISLRRKVQALKGVCREMKEKDRDLFHGFRVELRIEGHVNFVEALTIAERNLSKIDLQYGVKLFGTIKKEEYLKIIETTIKQIERSAGFTGRSNSKLSAVQKHLLARLYNSFGYHHGKWERHLAKPTSRTIVSKTVQVLPPDTDSEEEEVMNTIKTRVHPKNQSLISAMRCKSGGMTKGFKTLEELAKWILRNNKNNWRKMYALKTGGKRKTTTRNSTSDDWDLASMYSSKDVTIGQHMYRIFNVAGDNQCLFHSLEGVFHPMFEPTKCPNYREIRMGVIMFYLTCPHTLRDYLQNNWPGVTDMADRAETLVNNPSEWGEMMDIIAAACHYSINFDVISTTKRNRSFIQRVRALRRDGSVKTNARHSSRIVYYVYGSQHFQVGHMIN